MAKIEVLPIVGMMLAECAQAGLMIVSKAAMATGMNMLVFVCYSNTLAAFVLLPTSLLFHRSTQRPPITFSVLGWFFLLGLLGLMAQLIGYAGINYSSPTLGTAMLNLVPAFTFVLAVMFRMENIDGRSCSTLAKTLGTVVSISGAFVVTLYKGPPLLMTTSVDVLSLNQLLVPQSNWVIGGMLLGLHCAVAAAWIIIQASVLKKFPAGLIIVFFYCFFVAIQSAVVLLFVQRDLNAWALNPRLRFFAVLYSGVFGSAFQVGVSTWCLNKTGPVFVSMFKPLGIVVAVAIGVIFLGDTFYLGSLIGAIVIVTGFYSVIWGKANEEKMDDGTGTRSSTLKNKRVPLLQSIIDEF